MEQRSLRSGYWRGGNQIRELGFVEEVDRALIRGWRVLGEVIVGLRCCGGRRTDQNGIKILFGFGQVQWTVIMQSLAFCWRWSCGGPS